jgi:Spy/CpxP family protein refolding chaperone
MKKVAILTLITVFALTGVAAAKGPGHRSPEDMPREEGQKGKFGMFWEKERVAEALSLTEGEKAKLTELHSDHRSTVKDMREDIREQRQALREVMESEDFSSSDAKKHFKRAEKIRSRIHEERFELRIEQRQILGQERYVKLRKMERRAMEKRRRNQEPGPRSQEKIN